jgi:transcriptional regulator with XRE-family HTH domain
MDIGARLCQLREIKKLSQGDIEQRTGLLRSYISRVENGHTVPSLETLEKLAKAFEMPLYALLYDGDAAPKGPAQVDNEWWGSKGKDARYLRQLTKRLSRMSESDRDVLLHFTAKLSKR